MFSITAADAEGERRANARTHLLYRSVWGSHPEAWIKQKVPIFTVTAYGVNDAEQMAEAAIYGMRRAA